MCLVNLVVIVDNVSDQNVKKWKLEKFLNSYVKDEETNLSYRKENGTSKKVINVSKGKISKW